jgi:hypothetical protein
MSKHVKSSSRPSSEPDFLSRLNPIEHRECRDYLFIQEIIRQEEIVKSNSKAKLYIDTVPGLAGIGELKAVIHVPKPEDWVKSRVAMIQQAWQLPKEFTIQIAENPTWFNHPAARIAVLWPELLDNKSYFEIACDERLRRIKAFLTLSPEETRLTSLAYLLNPHNPATVKRTIIEFALLSSATRQEQMDAFEANLKIHLPELFKNTEKEKSRAKSPYARPQGRGSEQAAILVDLNAIAAFQLCRIAKLPRIQVINLIRYPKGHLWAGQPVYEKTHELNKPLRNFPERLQNFRADLIANLIPLELLGLRRNPWDWID